MGVLEHVEGVGEVELLESGLRDVDMALTLHEAERLLAADCGLPALYDCGVEGDQQASDWVEGAEVNRGDCVHIACAVHV